jgi:hypothetical protein
MFCLGFALVFKDERSGRAVKFKDCGGIYSTGEFTH